MTDDILVRISVPYPNRTSTAHQRAHLISGFLTFGCIQTYVTQRSAYRTALRAYTNQGFAVTHKEPLLMPGYFNLNAQAGHHQIVHIRTTYMFDVHVP
jgi:hypothetical protein